MTTARLGAAGIEVLSRPSAAGGARVGAAGLEVMALQVSRPVATGTAVSSGQVTGPWTNFAIFGTTTATVTGLEPSTGYEFRVSAINSVGTGPPAGTAVATTTPEPTGYPNVLVKQGFGANAAGGGTSGIIYEVTNLNDSGPGSLRAALTASGQRRIFFKVAGLITLTSGISVSSGQFTLDGSTAPGPVCVKVARSANINNMITLNTGCTDVIIRHCRFRAGRNQNSQTDNLLVFADLVMIDHCSFAWSGDELLDIIRYDMTIQNCIFSEALQWGVEESLGVLISGTDDNGGNISYHHNLHSTNVYRGPMVTSARTVDVVNNVVYNANGQMSYGRNQRPIGPVINWVNNQYIPGPMNPSAEGDIRFVPELPNPNPTLWVTGTRSPVRPTDNLPQINAVRNDGSRPWFTAGSASTAPALSDPIQSAFDDTSNGLLAYVLANAGARLPAVDAIDQRILNGVANRTGGAAIADENQVGGYVGY